jgi:hypothetical protein
VINPPVQVVMDLVSSDKELLAPPPPQARGMNDLDGQ